MPYVLIKTDNNLFQTILMKNKRPGIQLFFEVGESLPVVRILPGKISCVESNAFDIITFDVEICSLFPPFMDSFCQFSCIFVLFVHLSYFACLFGEFVMEIWSFRDIFSFPSMFACFLHFCLDLVFVVYLSLHVAVFFLLLSFLS